MEKSVDKTWNQQRLESLIGIEELEVRYGRVRIIGAAISRNERYPHSFDVRLEGVDDGVAVMVVYDSDRFSIDQHRNVTVLFVYQD